jgi:hypothetical protein
MPDSTGRDAPRFQSTTPTRPAHHNRSTVAGNADQHVDGLLPSLDPGVTLLDIETDRNVPVVHALVCDHLLQTSGPAFWVDAQGYATTATLTQIAPSRRLLDRIHVARGFTAYQHFSALADLPAAVNDYVKMATTTDPFRHHDEAADDEEPQPTQSLVVDPAVDALYRADDTLGDAQTHRLLARSLARLRQYADAYDVPVLCTRTEGDALTDPIESEMPAYRISKAGLNALTVSLDRTYADHGLIANSVDPGWVATELGGSEAPRDPEKGAETPVWLCRFQPGSPAGLFWKDREVIDY